MSEHSETAHQNNSPEQQLLDKLKEFIEGAAKTGADAKLAGIYAVKFCKQQPLGRSETMPNIQEDLAALQIDTINQCVADMGKKLEFSVMTSDKKQATITGLQFQDFDPDNNAWKILGNNGEGVIGAIVETSQLTEGLRLSE